MQVLNLPSNLSSNPGLGTRALGNHEQMRWQKQAAEMRLLHRAAGLAHCDRLQSSAIWGGNSVLSRCCITFRGVGGGGSVLQARLTERKPREPRKDVPDRFHLPRSTWIPPGGRGGCWWAGWLDGQVDELMND